MPQIYQNSVTTITGPAAADSEAGFLHNSRPINRTALDFNYELPNRQGKGHVEISYEGHQRAGSFMASPENRSAISKRAWILQERLLSSRILYFGSRQMYWECFTNMRYERLQFPMLDDYYRNDVGKVAFQSTRDSSGWLLYWYRIIKTYSTTEMSVPSDKLPALSGLANQIQKVLGYRYVAGLWQEDLLRGLSWYKYSHLNGAKDESRLLEYRAPSWSWASQQGAIWQHGMNIKSTFLSRDADIVSVKVESKGPDPFGSVQFGILQIHTKVRLGTIRKLPHHRRSGELGLYLCQGGFEVSMIGQYFPDSLDLADRLHQFTSGYREDTDKPVQCKVLLVLLSMDGADVSQWVALAVEKVMEMSNQYRRVGLVQNDCSDDESARCWFEKSEYMLLEIV